jgi:phage terminase large subunit-like protein
MSAAAASGALRAPVKRAAPMSLSESLFLFSRLCVVPEGALVGKPLALRPWQKQILRHFDGPDLRRLIISMPRKNGKSALIAFLVLAALCGPLALQNGTVYSAARSRDQAAIVFKLAKGMISQSPYLTARLKIRDSIKEIQCDATGVTYRAISADAKRAHGYSPFLVIHDELGQVRGLTDDLYDALETAGGAQSRFTSIVISTQAPNDQALLSVLIDDALANPQDRSTRLVLYTAPDSADPYEPATWAMCNPALGDFRSLKDVHDLAARAKRMPSSEAGFLNLILNRRISESAGFISPSVWGAGARPVNDNLFYEEPVFAGLDLSATTALTAFVLAVRDPLTDEHHLKPYFFMPAETLEQRSAEDRAPYVAWAERGLIELVPGKVVDLDHVASRIIELTRGMHLAEIRYDRWRIEEFKTSVGRAGGRFEMIPHGQGYKDMAPTLDRFERLAVEGKIRHGANLVLTWNFANVHIARDPAGNRKIDRAVNTGARNDGAVAAVMATAIMEAERMDGGRSVYVTKSRPSGLMALGERLASGAAALRAGPTPAAPTPMPATSQGTAPVRTYQGPADPFADLDDGDDT